MDDGFASGVVADGYQTYFTEVIISGVRSLEWKFFSLFLIINPMLKKNEPEHVRSKTTLGTEQQDTPTIDSNIGKKGKEYCDIITMAEKIDTWEEAMMDHYTSML